MKLYRQGDVLLKRIDRLPNGCLQHKDNVIAQGEVTGHQHRFDSHQRVVFHQGDDLFVELEQETPLVHDEHKTILVSAGFFAVIREREYLPMLEKSARVMD